MATPVALVTIRDASDSVDVNLHIPNKVAKDIISMIG